MQNVLPQRRIAVLEQWMLLETDPKAAMFCERPGEMQFDAGNRFAHFPGRCIDRDQFSLSGFALRNTPGLMDLRIQTSPALCSGKSFYDP
jgi:hypothetical protein